MPASARQAPRLIKSFFFPVDEIGRPWMMFVISKSIFESGARDARASRYSLQPSPWYFERRPQQAGARVNDVCGFQWPF